MEKTLKTVHQIKEENVWFMSPFETIIFFKGQLSIFSETINNFGKKIEVNFYEDDNRYIDVKGYSYEANWFE